MFNSKLKIRIAELEKHIELLNTQIYTLQNAIIDTSSLEERIKQKEHKNKCIKLDVCHICGRDLIIRDRDPEDENLPEFEHYCIDHGIVWIDRW